MYLVVPNLKGHFLNYIKIFESRSDFDDYIVLESGIKGYIKLFRVIMTITKRVDLYFLHGEKHVLLSIFSLLLPNVNVSCIYYYAFNKNQGVLKKNVSKIFVNALTILGANLFYLEKPEKIIIPSLNPLLFYLPDPVLSSYNLEQHLPHKINATPTVLIAGYLDFRKSVDKLLIALDEFSLKSNINTIKILLVGEQSDEVLNFINEFKPRGNLTIFQHNERVSDDELSMYIQMSDIISCVYQNHMGSSGMFINSVAHGKKVLFIAKGVLHDFAAELKIKATVKNDSAKEISTIFSTLLNNDYIQYTDDARNKFLQKRTTVAFVSKLLEWENK